MTSLRLVSLCPLDPVCLRYVFSTLFAAADKKNITTVRSNMSGTLRSKME
jgi:hypothetical protein